MTFEMLMMWLSGAGIIGGVILWMADDLLGRHTIFPYILLGIGVLVGMSIFLI